MGTAGRINVHMKSTPPVGSHSRAPHSSALAIGLTAALLLPVPTRDVAMTPNTIFDAASVE